MRLIPGKTKVKIELFKGITIGDVVVAVITLGLMTLVLLSSIPGKLYIALVILAIGAILVFRLDTEPTYVLLINSLKYLSFPRGYFRVYDDEHLMAKAKGTEKELYFKLLNEKLEEDPFYELSPRERRKAEKRLFKEEKKTLKSKAATDEEKNAIWLARAKRSEIRKKRKQEAKEEKEENFIEDIIPFTGVEDGFIEYDGQYYGTVIEVDPVEFRFFSEHRRNASIEDHFGKILRSLRSDFAFNIIKIERPIIYDDYLDKEYDKLDALRASYESGLINEEELKARVEVQYDRINALRDICFDNKVVNPFYYIALFNSDKNQLLIETKLALVELAEGELPVRRLTDKKELCVFLKYTNSIDFEERDIDELDEEDYVAWAMPESLRITTRNVRINKIVTHQLKVASYPSAVGDAWLAGVMSIPGTKVVVKCTPMDRAASVKAIDRSLAELRGQYATTNVDSKLLELQEHIETLSELLVTLQQDNEALLTVNVYISMYDSVKTSLSTTDSDFVKDSILPVIADMKKTVSRNWVETGMRLNPLDFVQLQAFIASQVSAYDPFIKDGRGIPANTVAAIYPWVYANISDKGGIRLGEHEGVPVFMDFFRRDSERVNSNMVIIGKSGAGKSYGTKSILVNMASEDAKIFILDPENEYMELAHNLHGKVINVGNASQGRLNPFHIITALEDDEAGDEAAGGSFATHLQFLEEFFKQILPDIDKDSLEYLNSLVERTYANKGIVAETNLAALSPEDYPIFDDLYDVVLAEFQRTDNQYLRSMLQTLMNYISKFSTGGRNSVIWNGPSSVTTEENFTVFNFQSLLSNRNQTVANAQMLLVLKYIDNEIIKNRDYNRKYGLNRKIVVVIDEAHVFIDNKYPVALDFMFQLAKRIRKYNGMQIVITQNIKDFVGSEEIARKSTAIINACQYSFIFGLAPNDMDDLCRLYEKAGGINPLEQEQILTAPRGHAFTIMSPTSRSFFKVSVPDTMVQMFENMDYESRYFEGRGGKENWEEFIGDSRAAHEENVREKVLAKDVEKIISSKRKDTIHFEEITPEEADRMDMLEEVKGITFEELEPEIPEDFVRDDEFDDIDLPEEPLEETIEAPSELPSELPAKENENILENAQRMTSSQGIPLNITEIIDLIRSEVRREMELQMMTAPKAPEIKEPEKSLLDEFEESEEPEETLFEEFEEPEEIEEPENMEDMEEVMDEDEELEESFEGSEETEEYESDEEDEEDDEEFDLLKAFSDDEDDDSDEDEDEEVDDDDAFSFDLMSILDEQLKSYNEMDIEERMEEVDALTMDITVEDLAAYVKKMRKKRGA